MRRLVIAAVLLALPLPVLLAQVPEVHGRCVNCPRGGSSVHEHEPSAAEIRREKEYRATYRRYRQAYQAAHQSFQKGRKALDHNDWPGALNAFQHAWDTLRHVDVSSEPSPAAWMQRNLPSYQQALAVAHYDYALDLLEKQDVNGALSHLGEALYHFRQHPVNANYQAVMEAAQSKYNAVVQAQQLAAEQQRKRAEEDRRKQAIRANLDQLSSTVAGPVRGPVAPLDFMPAGAAAAGALNCNGAMGQLCSANQHSLDARDAAQRGKFEKASDTAQVPFDKSHPLGVSAGGSSGIILPAAQSDGGRVPEKLKANPQASKRYEELQSRRQNLQAEHKELAGKLDALRTQRGQDGAPTPEEAVLAGCVPGLSQLAGHSSIRVFPGICRATRGAGRARPTRRVQS